MSCGGLEASGLAFTVGGLAAIVGVPNDDQRRRLARADRLMQLANRFDLPLLILAALTMAIGRYL